MEAAGTLLLQLKSQFLSSPSLILEKKVVWDIFVRLEPLISKKQKFLNSDFPIEKSIIN